MSVLKNSFNLAYQVSPIWLTGGLFSFVPTGFPIAAVLQGLTGVENILSGRFDLEAIASGNYFANFVPIAGGTIVKNEIAEYPFYSGQIAANAQIQQPLDVSLLMYCPASDTTSFTTKLATMTLLQKTLSEHLARGGTFTVLTPAMTYTGCLLKQIVDVSSNETAQTQFAYQWDFVQPLLTFPNAGSILNNLMGKISSGFPVQMDANGGFSWSFNP